jgi:hypothetical protein
MSTITLKTTDSWPRLARVTGATGLAIEGPLTELQSERGGCASATD